MRKEIKQTRYAPQITGTTQITIMARLTSAVLAIALILLTAMTLTGCSSRGETEPQPEETTVITIWTKDRHDAKFQQEKIAQYNRSNTDHIKVEYKIFSDNYYQALNTAFQSNNAPDMMAYTEQVFGSFFSRNYFADLMPYMDEEYRQAFDSILFEGINLIGGKCYFLPTGATTARLYYNKEIFSRAGIARPPETMEEMIADARLITKTLSGEGVYGFGINMNTPKSAIDRTLMKQGNKELGLESGYDFGKGCYDFEPYAELVAGWRELLAEDCAYPRCRDLDIDPLRQMFAEGQIGMYISYIHAEAGIYENQFPMNSEWGCVPVPTLDGKIKGSQNYTLENGYLFNARSEHLEEAWRVYRAIFTDMEYLKEYDMSGLGCSIVPTVQKMAASDGYVPRERCMMLLEDDKMWPRTPHEVRADAVRVRGLDMYDTIKNLVFGEGDIGAELTDLTGRYNEAYRKGIANNIGSEVRIEDFDPMDPLRGGEQKK